MNGLSRWRLAALLIAALTLAACGSPGAEDLTDRVITDDELATMALLLEAYGPDYEGFEPDEDDNGYSDVDEKIEDATDEEDEREDLERYKFVREYDQVFNSVEAILTGDGVAALGSTVELYEDANGAEGYFDDSIADIEAEVGVPDDDGNVLESYDGFEVPKIGDEAAGIVFKVALEGGGESMIPVVATGVQFRVGRIISNVIVIRLDRETMEEDAIDWAEQLHERVVAMLEGDIDAMPPPTAEPTESAAGRASPMDALQSFRAKYEMVLTLGEEQVTTVKATASYVAPASVECSLDVSAGVLGNNANVVIVGNDAWIDQGTGWAATTTNDADVVDALENCPVSPDFWDNWAQESIEAFPGQPEVMNGVASRHLDLGAAVEQLGSLGFASGDLEGTTINQFEYWVAEGGGWTVAIRMSFQTSGEGALFGQSLAGQSAGVTITVDVLNANDPSIEVLQPVP